MQSAVVVLTAECMLCIMQKTAVHPHQMQQGYCAEANAHAHDFNAQAR
jgi:hypothetical protein